MGSSGGSTPKAPKMTPPPSGMISDYGSTAPFNPSYINFLGDTNVPSTGLTPDMLAQIDAMNGAPMAPPAGGAGGGDRNLLAEILAKLEAMGQRSGGPFQQRREIGGGGNRAGSAGYSTSGRAGAGGFGSRSSSASRAGGGLY